MDKGIVKLFSGLVLLLVLLILVNVNAGAPYSINYDYTRNGTPVYQIMNHTNRWAHCEVVGEGYYYNDFSVAPYGASRIYTVPRENFLWRCQ